MYAAVITLPSSFGSWNRGPYIWQTWPQWHIYVSDGGQKNEGVEKNQNADSLGRDFEFCCLCFFPPSPIFSERIRTAARYILETPTRDKSKQKIGFYAHLFSKATEVSKVRLQHFSLGSFLRDVDEMRNLWRESIGADQLKLFCLRWFVVHFGPQRKNKDFRSPVRLSVSAGGPEEVAAIHFLPLKIQTNS